MVAKEGGHFSIQIGKFVLSIKLPAQALPVSNMRCTMFSSDGSMPDPEDKHTAEAFDLLTMEVYGVCLMQC